MNEPGRFAFDLWWKHAGPLNFDKWPDRWAAVESAIRADEAAKVRAETIEEAAKVVEAMIDKDAADSGDRSDMALMDAVAAIRALGDKAANPSRPE
jgi:hypothetical protein